MRGHGYILAAAAAMLIGGFLLLDGAQANWKEDQAACTANGGTFTFEGGQVSCVTSTCVGNSGGGGCGQTVDSEETSNGSFNNRPQHKDKCEGPGNGGSTAQCP
jgi:hypothetical protein